MIRQEALIAERQIWPDERLRVLAAPFRGGCHIRVQRFYRDGDEYRPGKGGVSFHVRHLAWTVEALRCALETAETEGWL